MTEPLFVLVDPLVYDAPVDLDKREMPQDLADAINSGYREQGIGLRWERCGRA